jgi:hypothetical protein
MIPGFLNYQVTSDGRVINSRTGRDMIFTPTQAGDPTVGLMKNGKQYRRSVRVLVAEAFVEGQDEFYDTPIQLDGNRDNVRADNLLWRPRWFAWRYVRQFRDPIPSWYYIGPIMDTSTGMQYRTIYEAAVTNGNLCEDIHNSVLYDTPVFPVGEKYVYM